MFEEAPSSTSGASRTGTQSTSGRARRRTGGRVTRHRRQREPPKEETGSTDQLAG